MLFYERLAGRPPFWADSDEAIMSGVAQRRIPSPRRLASHVPTSYQAVLGRALAVRADQRYPNARSFADDLGRLARGETVRPCSHAPWAPAHLGPDYPVRARILAVVLALLVLGAISLWLVLRVFG